MPRIVTMSVAYPLKQLWLVGVIVAAAIAGMATGPAQAQSDFPSRPITFVLPISPGSAMDVLARLYIDRIAKSLNATTVVSNRPGAGGLIASQTVLAAPADGYTFLVTNSGHLNLPLFNKALPFDPVNDFSTVAMLGEAPSTLAVPPALGVKTLKEFLDLARQKPGAIHYASAGVGTSTHLAGAYFEKQANIRMTHVPYKDMSVSISDLVSNLVQASFGPVGAQSGLFTSGKLLALAVSSRESVKVPIATPSAISQGVDYVYSTWYGILAAKGTPPNIIAKLSNAIVNAGKEPELIEKVTAQGIIPNAGSSEELQRHINSEIERLAPILKEVSKELEKTDR